MHLKFHSRYIGNILALLFHLLGDYHKYDIDLKMWTTSDFMILNRLVSDIEFYQKIVREQYGPNSTSKFTRDHIMLLANQLLRLVADYTRNYDYRFLEEVEVTIVNSDENGFYIQLVPLLIVDMVD